MTATVLTQAELNRATLARQLLLERVQLDPVTAVERICGLQAQEPASPYLALWSRLIDFRAAAIDRAIHDRRLVKAGLLRGTLHLVSSDDYLRLHPAVRVTLQGLAARDQYRNASSCPGCRSRSPSRLLRTDRAAGLLALSRQCGARRPARRLTIPRAPPGAIGGHLMRSRAPPLRRPESR